MRTSTKHSLALRALIAAGLIGVSGALVACGSTTPPATDDAPTNAAPAETQQAATTPIEVRAEDGVPSFFAHALKQVNLRADQKVKVEAIVADLKTSGGQVTAERKALASMLAAQIEKGAIDQAAIDAQVAKLGDAADATKPALQTAMTKLHAVLDAGQRKAFVDGLRSHGGARGEEMHEHLKKVAEKLGLSDDQRKSIRQAMHAERKDGRGERGEHGAMKAHMDAIAEAFASESFDAKALDVGSNARELVTRGADQIVKLTAATLPTLTAEQRTKLATIVRERAERSDG